ncbi:Ger(x)C family spore germination protein [Paenibacillus roseipurpureus]|uniref:Ger(X)C family spore germination protein n=1 Tax=Paenibacillus roseopurpureus TaxID=2918901 RepID=A0AA96LQI1_9BACL|nr:Ger(x)C family spore germination protein [Paenibacillus sp. MBLB1832]WNR44169.1 Ger(x)C family spore germination protein [Paenibacillus sp. MBLB1832]
MFKTQYRCLLIGLLAVLTGCGSDQRILEKIGLTHTTCFDLMPEGKLRVTNSIPLSTGEGRRPREVLTTISDSSKGAKVDLSRQTQLTLVSGQMRNILFGWTLAERGFWDDIDTLVRDPSVSPRVKVTVVNGEAHSLIIRNYSNYLRTAKYIDHLLESEIKIQTIPKVTLYDFTRDYYDDGIDPVAPIINELTDHVKVDGIALFQDDRLRMKVDVNESVYFAMMRDDFKMASLPIVLSGEKEKKELVLFDSLINKRRIRVARAGSHSFRVDIQLKVSGVILEYMGDLKISKEEDKHKLEEKIAAKITQHAEAILKRMQQKNVDSLGLGNVVKSSVPYKEWKNMNWREVYPDIEIHCATQVKIKHYGKQK